MKKLCIPGLPNSNTRPFIQDLQIKYLLSPITTQKVIFFLKAQVGIGRKKIISLESVGICGIFSPFHSAYGREDGGAFPYLELSKKKQYVTSVPRSLGGEGVEFLAHCVFLKRPE